jgi:hypothetical protein
VKKKKRAKIIMRVNQGFLVVYYYLRLIVDEKKGLYVNIIKDKGPK